jgi:hypothetical protein
VACLSSPAQGAPDRTLTFITLDDVFKPQAVSLALGYDRAKRPDAEIVGVTGIDRVVPVIVTSCRARPSETLLKRVRARLHTL